ncbi:MAG: DNA alkylation repair protein [Bacteroidales bacterium]|jgi:3-methyladenine DNA glycosylase AlkD|nr:DNA alkylation repair protein [Bacteroidales bacterium]
MIVQTVIDSLQYLSNEDKAKHLQSFFKTQKGEYGEGDIFWGITVPETKRVARTYLNVSFFEIEEMLKNPVHEVRSCALMILVEQFKRVKPIEKKLIVDFYLANTPYINSWDLVDLSSYNILGKYLTDKPRDILYQLAKSENMWEQRISIVSTYAFIRNHDYEDTLALSEMLLGHSHDLIHKATGWMLREIAKRDESCMINFVQTHYGKMPRITLRYAIEKLPKEYRQNILIGKFE